MVCVCEWCVVCVGGQRGSRGERDRKREREREREKERESAMRCPALKLPVYFQSLHQLHWYSTQTSTQSMCVCVCVCVCACDVRGSKKQLRMICMEMCVLSFAVSSFMRVTHTHRHTHTHIASFFLFCYQGEKPRKLALCFDCDALYNQWMHA